MGHPVRQEQELHSYQSMAKLSTSDLENRGHRKAYPETGSDHAEVDGDKNIQAETCQLRSYGSRRPAESCSANCYLQEVRFRSLGKLSDAFAKHEALLPPMLRNLKHAVCQIGRWLINARLDKLAVCKITRT